MSVACAFPMAALRPALGSLFTMLVAAACSAPCGVRLARSMDLPGVAGAGAGTATTGRIDHLAYDPATERLFVACVGNGSLEVLDLASGRHVASIGGLDEPQGVAVVPRPGAASRVFVACGGDGTLRAYDAASLQTSGQVVVGDDADNVRWDARTGKLYVGNGGSAGGAITAVDPDTLAVATRTALAAHAEGFRLDPAGPRLFVNVPGGKVADEPGTVVVANRDRGTIEASWSLRGAARNFPLAYVAERRLVLVVCRKPPLLIALDAATGDELARTPCIADADDLFFDAATGRAFVVGGGDGAESGALEVFDLPSRGGLRRVAASPLPRGSRTGLFVPERRALYVAAPIQPGAPARILEFLVD